MAQKDDCGKVKSVGTARGHTKYPVGTRIYHKEMRERVPIAIGEHIIVKDGPLATIVKERNWMEINYYTTITPSLEDHANASRQARLARLKEATFLRTWVLRSSGGLPTTIASTSDRDRVEHLWRERIPTEHVDDHIMVRDSGVNARGKLDRTSREIAAGLDILHNCGACLEHDAEHHNRNIAEHKTLNSTT